MKSRYIRGQAEVTADYYSGADLVEVAPAYDHGEQYVFRIDKILTLD